MARKILLKTRSEPAYYTLIGISCHLMDYRFLHMLNRGLGFNFTREDDLRPGMNGMDQSAAFSFYSYFDEDQRNSYYLVANFSGDSVLVPQVRHIDFILMIDGTCSNKKKEALMNTIRSIPKVQTAFELKTGELKNAESFLTDIEMHISDINQEIKSRNPNIYLTLKGGKTHV